MRLHKIVAEFVHENLIPGIDRAARDHLASLSIALPGRDSKIIAQGIRRSVDEEILLRQTTREKVKKKANFLGRTCLTASSSFETTSM